MPSAATVTRTAPRGPVSPNDANGSGLPGWVCSARRGVWKCADQRVAHDRRDAILARPEAGVRLLVLALQTQLTLFGAVEEGHVHPASIDLETVQEPGRVGRRAVGGPRRVNPSVRVTGSSRSVVNTRTLSVHSTWR